MKKAIVIGATSGIGKGLAQSLMGCGYKVGVTGRREHPSDLHNKQIYALDL
ncbi:MAG: SDR family NAD(P)-dependent oxidoreductase [Bacteroidales bacterium]